MHLRYDTVDAFTKEAFKGNPAAIFVLENAGVLDERTMQLIAREINYSETAFTYPLDGKGRFSLRWMLPCLAEAPICGHATLATAKILFDRHTDLPLLTFDTLAGKLLARKLADTSIELDFPADRTIVPFESEHAAFVEKTWLRAAPALSQARFLATCRDMSGSITCVELPDGQQLADLQVDSGVLSPLEELVRKGPWTGEGSRAEGSQIKLTCKAPAGSGRDIDSRVFCPTDGIPEDSVTGSAHCSLSALSSS